MLKIVYFSNVTENTHRFIHRYLRTVPENTPAPQWLRLPIKGEQPVVEGDYILVVPTYGSAKTQHVPPQVKKFLTDAQNREGCVGVIGVGNINFGVEFGVAANMIAQKLDIPVLHKVDLSGDEQDIAQLQRLMELDREQINYIEQSRKQAVSS